MTIHTKLDKLDTAYLGSKLVTITGIRVCIPEYPEYGVSQEVFYDIQGQVNPVKEQDLLTKDEYVEKLKQTIKEIEG